MRREVANNASVNCQPLLRARSRLRARLSTSFTPVVAIRGNGSPAGSATAPSKPSSPPPRTETSVGHSRRSRSAAQDSNTSGSSLPSRASRIARWCWSSVTADDLLTVVERPELATPSRRSIIGAEMRSSPRSQRATVLGCTPTASASSFCVRPSRSRSVLRSSVDAMPT